MNESYKDGFKAYLEDHEGKPIDPKIVEEGERDLRTAKKGDYTIHRYSANNPKDKIGEVFRDSIEETGVEDKMETDVISDLQKTVEDLTDATNLFNEFILDNKTRRMEGLETLRLADLDQIEEIRNLELKNKIFGILAKYNFDFNTEIKDVGDLIKDKIQVAKNIIEKSRQ